MESTQVTQRITAPPTPIRLCVIDLGTNSFHAVIVDVNPTGTFTILDKIKEMVKLGEGGFSRHRLSEVAMQRGVDALRRIRILAEGWGAEEYMAFGTSAIREADNGGVFIQKVREELDLNIRAISGDMETRLIYEGVRRAVDLSEPTLLVDIGGGSTEFVVGDSTEPYFLRSLKLGAARITERFVTTDPIDKTELKTLREFYRDKLNPVVAASEEHGVRDLVGSSGTIENLAQVFLNEIGETSRSIYQYEFDAKGLRRIAKMLIAST
ncbi:MAG: Ppx/GppA family phosphatase, partial [Rhodothermia bacterium]|nr:Ppx/GppA family phosphatase [Rhodothermia bacterium]